VGARDSGMAMRPSANFHHASFSLKPSLSCEVCHGSRSDRGPRTKAAAGEAQVCPPVRLLAWLSCQPFDFPKQLLSPPWCPLQCTTTTCLGALTAFSNFRIFCPYLTLFSSQVRSPDWQCRVFNDSVPLLHIQQKHVLFGQSCCPL
jgi:hypothetical protein